MVCDGLRWSAMLLEAQNRREKAHFIAACGRAFRPMAKTAGKTDRAGETKQKAGQEPKDRGSNLSPSAAPRQWGP